MLTSSPFVVDSHTARFPLRWNAATLLGIVNDPREPSRVLAGLRNFASSKDFWRVARKLNKEEAAEVVDVFDQVRHDFRDTPLDQRA
jgi:hypothetical protein